MSITATNRFDAIVDDSGRASIRFADVLEDVVAAVNALVAIPINNQSSSYTLDINDAGKIIRQTGDLTNRIFTVPANADVAFDIGTRIEVQNDGTQVLNVDVDVDTLTSEAGLGTGLREISPAGSAVLTKVDTTAWKIRGEQLA